MRERPSRRTLFPSVIARDAARLASAVLATLGLASGGIAAGTTSFGASYVYGTSGPASGGPAYIIGNQFLPGAAVTVGGLSASAVVTTPTLITVTMPARTAGGLYDIIVDNGGGNTSVLPQAWFANFNDVPQADPFHASVEALVRDGITSGCGSGNYCLSSQITRAQMAVFLLRAEHGKDYFPPAAVGIFTDVIPGTTFAADWVEQLYTEGITAGCSTSPKKFCPDASVTRGQMAVFLLAVYHGSGYAPPAAVGLFTDVPVSSGFAPWVEELSRLKVTAGCGGANYCPNSNVTRGQMAIFMNATFHRPEATRFLEQASWGPTDLSISTLLGQGNVGWLASQYGAPVSSYPVRQLWPDSTPSSCDTTCRRDNYSMYPLQTRFFVNAMYGPDQLRQRIAFALHKIDVASGQTLFQPSWMVPYLRIFDYNALGNYRDILYNVTLNAGMGEFLNMDTSTKGNPNENYAREIMQLFSIGTELLSQDGTTQNDVDGPLPTYDQSVIDNLKKVFTGWYVQNNVACDPASAAGSTCRDFIAPMSFKSSNHDVTTKMLFSGFLPNLDGAGGPTTIAGDATGLPELNQAIDALFQHPNTGPYVARELIHSLVTSNPSPEYVERVAGFFNNDGTGARGNLWAVVKAILLDPEARTDPASDLNYGKLREPVLYINNILRAFNAMSVNRAAQSDGYVNPQAVPMGQDTLRPNTVFSYFPQDYFAPPASAGLLGPEFGIMDASTSLKRANFINTMVYSSIGVSTNAPNGTSIDLSELQQLAPTAGNLVDRLNRLMLHGTMSSDMRDSIITAVNAVTPSTDNLKRARQALYLVATSSQYQAQR